MGVRIIVVTGDYSITAISIANQAGILSEIKYDTYSRFRENISNRKRKAIVLNGNSDHLDNDSNSPLLSQNYKLKTSYISPSKLICNEKK